MSAIGYKKSLEVARRRNDEDTTYSSMLNGAQTELRTLFQRTHSCLAIGAGYGERDVEFMKRFMPDLELLIAVEPEADCVDGLMTTLQQQLPNVRSIVHQQKIQQWRGVEQPVDSVLMFHIIYYLNKHERCLLMERLFDEIVKPCGHLVVLATSPNFLKSVLKLIAPSFDAYPEVATFELEIAAVGFRQCFRRQFQVSLSMIPPFETDLLRFFLMLLAKFGVSVNADVEEVRQIVEREFVDKCVVFSDTHHLIVYRKPPTTQ